MTGDYKRLEPRRDTNMAETNFRGKNSKTVTSRENTLLDLQLEFTSFETKTKQN